jgi:sulfite exporter TauE/SafE
MAGGGNSAGAPVAPLRPARTLAWRQLAYNAGRITTYALLGAAAGGAGGALLAGADWLPLQRTVYVVANLFLLGLAVAIAWKRAGLAWLQSAGNALFAKALPAVRPLRQADSTAARYALGMIWGLVPCALTYSVLPIAAFAGGALQGAAVMLAFGIGTLPNLLAAGWLVSRAGRWLDAPAFRLAAAALIAGFAAVGLWRALLGTGSLAQGPFCL